MPIDKEARKVLVAKRRNKKNEKKEKKNEKKENKKGDNNKDNKGFLEIGEREEPLLKTLWDGLSLTGTSELGRYLNTRNPKINNSLREIFDTVPVICASDPLIFESLTDYINELKRKNGRPKKHNLLDNHMEM